jgi:hypothetical protein
MMDEADVEPIPLSALSGAALTWEEPDGTVNRVEFGTGPEDDQAAADSQSGESQ